MATQLGVICRRLLPLMLGLGTTALAQQIPQQIEATADHLMPMEATVNGEKSGVWLFLERGGVLYAPHDAFEEWRVRLNQSAIRVKLHGEDYWPLTAVPGHKSKIDFPSQTIDLQFPAEAFPETRVGLKLATQIKLDSAVPSVFVNYDMNYQRSDPRGASITQDLGVLTEFGYSSDLGVLTTSVLGQNLIGSNVSGNQRRFLRLETTMTVHRPNEKQTLTVGDTSTRLGTLGSGVFFGGVRFGSNFALVPGFVSQPIPILTGSSLAPSTVNLYVNDVLRQTSNVPTGPFAIDNFPVWTGGGEARVVVRDILGRETVVTQSFFSSQRLLATGLDDWSLEAGRLRENLGTVSNEYGAGFARGFWRYGYSDTVTLGTVAEYSAKLQKFELGLTTPLFGDWLTTTAGAVSREATLGTGQQWQLGLEQQGLHTGVYFQAQGATENYRALGQNTSIKPLKLQLAGNVSYASTSHGSFGVGFASSTPYDSARINTMSVNYSMRLGERSSLSLTASKSQGAFSGSSIGFTLVLPLPANGPVGVASGTRTGKQTDFYLAATQSPTLESDLGWRVLAGEQQSQRHAEGGLFYQGRYGTLTGDVSTSSSQNSQRISATGGLVFTDGTLFATTRGTDSFALVDVAGYGDVGVSRGGNVLTRTDKDGLALIPRMAAYQANSVRLAANDLPINAELESIEMQVVPPWRSVVRAKFPVRGGRGALLKIVFDDGDVAPAAAIVQIEGDSQEFYLARRGEAFVTGLQAKNRLVLKWKGRQCSFEVALPSESADEISRVGPILCKGVTR